MPVDAELVLRPSGSDVIVVSNLYVYIMSDLAAAIVGTVVSRREPISNLNVTPRPCSGPSMARRQHEWSQSSPRTWMTADTWSNLCT